MSKGGRGERKGGERGVFFLISFSAARAGSRGGWVWCKARDYDTPHLSYFFLSFLFFSYFLTNVHI